MCNIGIQRKSSSLEVVSRLSNGAQVLLKFYFYTAVYILAPADLYISADLIMISIINLILIRDIYGDRAQLRCQRRMYVTRIFKKIYIYIYNLVLSKYMCTHECTSVNPAQTRAAAHFVTTRSGLNKLKPSAAVEMSIPGICLCQCTSFTSC